MPHLVLDSDQRFKCAGCARCCHGDVAITPGERASYERAGAARWFRERDGLPEGASRDPFLPEPSGWFRIRRRDDGACGFLSPQNRCRLHEEMGGDRKPLVCRLFPFHVRTTERERIVAASFSCPTIVANEGEPASSRQETLRALVGKWSHEVGRQEAPPYLAPGRRLAGAALDSLRAALRQMIDRPGADGHVSLGDNLRRVGFWLHDLSRPRVLRLPPDDFTEYATVTGRHVIQSQTVAVPRAGRLSRVFRRGLLFLMVTAEAQRRQPHRSGLRLGLRWKLFRALLHAHGLGPALPELDMGAARRLRLDPEAAAPLVRRYLQASITTLGSSPRPVLDELAVAAAVLNGAIALGAGEARREGEATIGLRALRAGLVRASDATHTAGPMASILTTFAAGPDAFLMLADALASTRGPASA
jgi:Fe-S-cluster containining protein